MLDHYAVISRLESMSEDWEGILRTPLTFSTSRSDGAPIAVRQYRLAEDAEVELPSISDHAIMLLIGRPAYIERRIHDQYRGGIYLPGAGGILPAGATGAWRWIGAPVVVRVYLSAAWLDGILCEENLGPQDVKVLERSRCYDPFLWMFSTGLLRRMRLGPPIERIMLDSAALGLGCHLLHAHSTLTDDRFVGGRTLSTKERLRVSDFIDDAIAAEFGLGDLARAIGMRRLDLVKSFASANRGKLHGYLNGHRIEQARRLLRESRMTTGEIARAVGFKNVAALDLALYFSLGCSATEYRPDLG
jgi:AraC family transcriptional regulator